MLDVNALNDAVVTSEPVSIVIPPIKCDADIAYDALVTVPTTFDAVTNEAVAAVPKSEPVKLPVNDPVL